MMLQIGMEQMKEFMSVPGAVTVRPGDASDEELEVEVDGVEGAVDIPVSYTHLTLPTIYSV